MLQGKVSGSRVKTDEKHDGGVVLVPPSASGANKYLESRSLVRELWVRARRMNGCRM